MTGSAMTDEQIWPMRTWVLAIVGGLLAMLIHLLAEGDMPDGDWQRRIHYALPVFLGIGGLAFGLSWAKGRLIGSILLALACGVVAGGVFLWNGAPRDGSDSVLWNLVCGLGAAGMLLVLAQAGRDGAAPRAASWSPAALNEWRREAIRYADVHSHLWTDALLLGLSLVFAGIVIAIAHLLAQMFWLVKIGFLRDLLREDLTIAALLGTGLGAALGLLRDRGTIITALQRVAMMVLRVLAPVLAVGLFVFLAALPLTGLAPLWETGGTTPIMLAGALLALFLANAVVTDRPEDESRSSILSSSAAALGLFLVPMTGIAAFSSGLRIQQHGLSPDRIWALTFIIAASITAIAYAVTILGRRGWFGRLRQTNLHLVYILACMALLLSTPLLGFERIATAHQIARLAGGQVSAENFDYRALWFEFGPSGRAAIDRLATGSSDARIRRYAAETRKLASRWDDPANPAAGSTGKPLAERLTVLPRAVRLDRAIMDRLLRSDACGNEGAACTVRHVPGEDHAVVIRGPDADCPDCPPMVRLLLRDKAGRWADNSHYLPTGDRAQTLIAAVKAGKVEMRPVTRRQLFIDGKPAGDILPEESATTP